MSDDTIRAEMIAGWTDNVEEEEVRVAMPVVHKTSIDIVDALKESPMLKRVREKMKFKQ